MAKSVRQLPNTSPKKPNSKPEPEAIPEQPAIAVSQRKAVVRTVRNASIGTIVVLLLLVGAGVVYTWYVGQQPLPSSLVGIPEQQERKIIQPVTAAANANVGASVQSLTSPLSPGENASVIVRTRQYADCTIVVEYNKVASTDSGLKPKKADDFGIVSWTWTVEDTVPVGKWPLKVTCAYDTKSGFVQADLVVQLSTQE